jgi:hypothetical protein
LESSFAETSRFGFAPDVMPAARALISGLTSAASTDHGPTHVIATGAGGSPPRIVLPRAPIRLGPMAWSYRPQLAQRVDVGAPSPDARVD